MFSRNSGRIRFLAILTLCSASLTSAQSQAASQPAKSEVKIGFSIENLKIERWQTDSAAFKKRGEALGAQVIIDDAEGDRGKQLRNAKDLFDAGVQVLVLVAHNAETGAEIIKAAKARNVRVITYEAPVLAGEDIFITTDFNVIGRLQVSTLTDRAAAIHKRWSHQGYRGSDGAGLVSSPSLREYGQGSGLESSVDHSRGCHQ